MTDTAHRGSGESDTDTTTTAVVVAGSVKGDQAATILDRVVVRFAGDSGDGMCSEVVPVVVEVEVAVPA